MATRRLRTLLPACFCAALLTGAASPSAPPATPQQPVVDRYFGTEITDPYRWLEDDTDPRVKEWSAAQGDRARAVLDALPARAALAKKLARLINETSPEYSRLSAAGDRIFALLADPKFQQPRIVSLALDADPAGQRVLVDPNQLDPAGHTAIDWFQPSHDGALLAVSLSRNGSEDGTLHVFDTATGKEIGEEIPRVQFPTAGGSLAWNGDRSGFWYTRYPGEERPEADRHFYLQVYFHKLGADWRHDALILGTADGIPRIGEITLGNEHAPDSVVASVANGDGGEFAHWLLDGSGKKVQIARFADRVVAATLGPDHALYLVSRQGAPNGRVLKLDPGVTDLGRARVLVAEGPSNIVAYDLDHPRAPTLTDKLMLVTYISGGPNELRAFDLEGHPLGPLTLPAIAAFSSPKALPNGDVLISVSTYLRPPYYARWSSTKQTLQETKLAVTSSVRFDDVEVERAFATSKDGSRIPMSILRRKGAAPDGHRPTLLTGYGGYGLSMQPSFAGPAVRLWIDGGGVYVIANLRGGAEYGDAWHDQGRLTKKQNVFDDFEAVAESLLAAKVTDHQHLALVGGSNGGLLMGATLTQHPGLARAVVSVAGIYDMLRVELAPNGAFNTTEFGTVKDPAQFAALHAYSPYHHVRQGERYPAVLLMTGSNDGRVDPMHSRKFAAALQSATSSGLPVLLRISTTTGHGIGSSRDEIIALRADWMAFLFDQLGMKPPAGD